jgi:hypothetical protein
MLTKLSTFVFVGRNATAVRPYRPTSLQLAVGVRKAKISEKGSE